MFYPEHVFLAGMFLYTTVNYILRATIQIILRCILFLPFYRPRTHHVTCKLTELPTNTIGEIHADVIVYVFAHLHRALRTEGSMLFVN